MNCIKTASLAGILAFVSTMAFAQAGAPTEGVDLGTVYSTSPRSDSSETFAVAHRPSMRTTRHMTNRQSETTGSGSYGPVTGYGQPD